MENKILFNDEFIETRITALVDVEIGRSFINNEQVRKVHEVLELEYNSIDELRAKRNSVVKLISDIAHQYYNEEVQDFTNFDKYNNTISGVTAVIDTIIWNNNHEV